MSKVRGEPFRAEFTSADADPALVMKLYKDGSLVEYFLTADEYLEVHSLQIVSAAGGDIYVFIGADVTPGAGEYIVRGTVPANGGIVMEAIEPPHVGTVGHYPYVFAPAGQVDAILRGGIRKEGDGSSSAREGWKAAKN